MSALSTPDAPTAEVLGADAVEIDWTQVADADTYVIHVFPKKPHTATDWDLENTDEAVTVTRAPGTGATSEIITVGPDADNESGGVLTHSYKFKITAHDSTDANTDATSNASTEVIVVEPQEADETEAPVVAETVNPSTGQAFEFAGATYGYAWYTRNPDGTVSQYFRGGPSIPGTPGAQPGTQNTRTRDAGNVVAAKSLASDLRYKLTTGFADGVSYVLQGPNGPYLAGGTNTEEDYGIIGEGSIVNFVDRLADEVGAPKVSQSGTGKALTGEAATEPA